MSVAPADREAEWYRRKRADKDRVPLPPEFRLFDYEDCIEARFPVDVAAPVFQTIFPYTRTGAAPPVRLGIVFVGLAGTWAVLFCNLYLVVILLGLAAMAVAPLVLIRMLRRTVTIRAEGVEVGWWPIPFLARRLVSREITQAFVLRRGAPPAGVFPGDPDTGPAPEFEVWIIRRNGDRERLIASMRSADHALFLERWIERRLGIEDAPVAGEFS